MLTSTLYLFILISHSYTPTNHPAPVIPKVRLIFAASWLSLIWDQDLDGNNEPLLDLLVLSVAFDTSIASSYWTVNRNSGLELVFCIVSASYSVGSVKRKSSSGHHELFLSFVFFPRTLRVPVSNYKRKTLILLYCRCVLEEKWSCMGEQTGRICSSWLNRWRMVMEEWAWIQQSNSKQAEWGSRA